MTTSIEDALDAVSYLPERERLLIGRGMGIDEMDWVSGSMFDAQFVASIGDQEIQDEVSERAIKFKAGNARMALTVSIVARRFHCDDFRSVFRRECCGSNGADGQRDHGKICRQLPRGKTGPMEETTSYRDSFSPALALKVMGKTSAGRSENIDEYERSAPR